MLAIYKRELKSLFVSPIGYVFLFIIFLISGVFTYETFLLAASGTFVMVYQYIFIFSMMIIPVLTMRSMSEDKKQKTDQALLTAPVSLGGLVAGKTLAAFTVYAVSVFCTLIHAVTLSILAAGSFNWGIVLGNIAGTLFYGLAYISVGVFISSLTESQVVSAFATLGVGLFLMLVSSLSSMVDSTLVAGIVKWISFQDRYYEFIAGRFNLANVFFFLSVAGVFMFLTTRVLEKRRWS